MSYININRTTIAFFIFLLCASSINSSLLSLKLMKFGKTLAVKNDQIGSKNYGLVGTKLNSMMKMLQTLIQKGVDIFHKLPKETGMGLLTVVSTTVASLLLRKKNKEQATWKTPTEIGEEYDVRSKQGLVEAFWGEHYHFGTYTEEEIKRGFRKKDFKKSKNDLVEDMFKFGNLDLLVNKHPKAVLDVGCGVGGSSRILANKFGPGTKVTGITVSKDQVKRANELSKEKNVVNTEFVLMDALNMSYPDNSFDVIWTCECGEHMPDKKKFIEEMVRVLKPGGRLVIATWCMRDDTNAPLNTNEKKFFEFMTNTVWGLPSFMSIEGYAKIAAATKQLTEITTDDWTKRILPSLQHAAWVAFMKPWAILSRPLLWRSMYLDSVIINKMHRAFKDGLLTYGMITAVKK